MIPSLYDNIPDSSFWKAQYKGWSGVYDYTKLANSSDFVTLMAYDQHGDGTTPGPAAGLTWDEAIVKYALKYIPAQKISLGIPWHSGYWYLGNSLHVISVDLTYTDIKSVLDKNNVNLSWNDKDKIHYAIFDDDFHYRFAYLEDKSSYQAKLNLIEKYHLRGMSNWCLGEEDKGVWDLLIKKASA